METTKTDKLLLVLGIVAMAAALVVGTVKTIQNERYLTELRKVYVPPPTPGLSKPVPPDPGVKKASKTGFSTSSGT